MERTNNYFELKTWIENRDIETIEDFDNLEDAIKEFNEMILYGATEQEDYTIWIDEMVVLGTKKDMYGEDVCYFDSMPTNYSHRFTGLKNQSESRADILINEVEDLVADYFDLEKGKKYQEISIFKNNRGKWLVNDDSDDYIQEFELETGIAIIRVANHTDNEANLDRFHGSNWKFCWSIVISDNDPTERKFLDNGWGSPVYRLNFKSDVTAEEIMDVLHESMQERLLYN